MTQITLNGTVFELPVFAVAACGSMNELQKMLIPLYEFAFRDAWGERLLAWCHAAPPALPIEGPKYVVETENPRKVHVV